MNTKEIAAIRQSLRLIATGDTMGARRMLAGLTMSARPAAAKPVRSTKQKNQPAYNQPDHKVGCECGRMLCAAYHDDFSRALWFDSMVLYPQSKPNMANVARKEMESQASIRERLEVCACGHRSDQHTTDELENLLDCSYVGCECDHFHYQTETESAAAAR
jgi:hypothetical protein